MFIFTKLLITKTKNIDLKEKTINNTCFYRNWLITFSWNNEVMCWLNRNENISLLRWVLIIGIIFNCCVEKESFPDCYKGKVVTLNKGDGCNNILEIIDTNSSCELSTGSTTTFNPTLSRKKLRVGDIVYLKIIQYEKWIGPSNADCLWPQFTAQIEFCN